MLGSFENAALMNPMLLGLIAFAPLLTVGVLLVGFRWPAKFAMPAGFVVTLLLTLFVWQIAPPASRCR